MSVCRGRLFVASWSDCFSHPFVWAKALENAPKPKQRHKDAEEAKEQDAIKTRRLKKADCEVDFFFMDDEAELFPSAVNPKR